MSKKLEPWSDYKPVSALFPDGWSTNWSSWDGLRRTTFSSTRGTSSLSRTASFQGDKMAKAGNNIAAARLKKHLKLLTKLNGNNVSSNRSIKSDEESIDSEV